MGRAIVGIDEGGNHCLPAKCYCCTPQTRTAAVASQRPRRYIVNVVFASYVLRTAVLSRAKHAPNACPLGYARRLEATSRLFSKSKDDDKFTE